MDSAHPIADTLSARAGPCSFDRNPLALAASSAPATASNPSKHSQLFVETASFSEFPAIPQPLRLISLIRNRSSRNSEESLLKKPPSPGLE